MAEKQQLLESIKKAMQAEKDSVTLYENAANHARDEEVKKFFNERREEERRHFNYLLKYYQEISGDLQPSDLDPGFKPSQEETIFSDDFIRRIGEDQFLFSAISTALLLEKESFEHYSKCAQQTNNATLKSFFNILEEWEKEHYDELLRIQKDSERYYWEVNRFEPF